MVDTWSVSDNEGWSRICLSLCDCFDCLIVISAHSDLCYVYIAIAHCDACHIFLLGLFTTCCELCYCTSRSSFGGLSACVGVNLGIEHHYVDIFSAGKYVVYAAESDIVSPSVATEDPLGFLSEEVFVLNDVSANVAVSVFDCFYKFLGCSSVGSAAVKGIQILFACCFYFFRSFLGVHNILNFGFQAAADCFLSEKHTITELCVVLEQGVGPCRALSFLVYSVRSGR